MFKRVAMLALVLLAACGQQPPPAANSVTGVSVEAPKNLASRQRAEVSATVQGTGTFDKNVTWSVSGGGSFTATGRGCGRGDRPSHSAAS